MIVEVFKNFSISLFPGRVLPVMCLWKCVVTAFISDVDQGLLMLLSGISSRNRMNIKLQSLSDLTSLIGLMKAYHFPLHYIYPFLLLYSALIGAIFGQYRAFLTKFSKLPLAEYTQKWYPLCIPKSSQKIVSHLRNILTTFSYFFSWSKIVMDNLGSSLFSVYLNIMPRCKKSLVKTSVSVSRSTFRGKVSLGDF